VTAVRQADATTIAATSSAYGLSVDVSALGLNLDVGPLPTGVLGVAPAPYNLADSVANVSVVTSVPVVVSGEVGADLVNATAFSNVNALPGSRLTSASGGIVGADIGAVTLPLLGPGLTILSLNGTLNSTAQITGDFGSLVATGTTTIESLGLTIGGTVVNLAPYVGVAVAPNTSINLAGLGILNTTLILNDQIVAPDNSSITVNALRLTTNLLNISGEVILGHSQASVSAIVPEPAAAMLMILGLIPISLRRRTRLVA
jgi:hypothetical protein